MVDLINQRGSPSVSPGPREAGFVFLEEDLDLGLEGPEEDPLSRAQPDALGFELEEHLEPELLPAVCFLNFVFQSRSRFLFLGAHCLSDRENNITGPSPGQE